MKIISSEDLTQCVDLAELNACMAQALQSMSGGQARNFPRLVNPLDADAVLGFMPAMNPQQNVLGYKAISIFHSNARYELNPHQGMVVLLDATTGVIKSIIEGSTLTALRTAAVSAVATALLSRLDSQQLGLLGTGRQAMEHVKAIANVRPIHTVHLYERSPGSANAFVQFLNTHFSFEIRVHKTAKETVKQADIIVTCTPATTAFIELDEIPEGAHINAIGASRPGYQEIRLYNRDGLKIYLDSKSACFIESEEIFSPLNTGNLSKTAIVGELGACLAHQIEGRIHEREITVFKSVGLSIEDVYAADYFYKKALAMQLGKDVNL